MSEPARVVVTGGAGYIGSFVTRQLLEKGYRVRVLDKLAWGRDSLAGVGPTSRLEIVPGDIRHVEDLVDALRDCRGVIHLAGIVGDPACDLDPDTTYGINLQATRVIVDVARYHGLERFVFASTCSVYGAAGDEWLDETSPLGPVSLYAETNRQSEEIVLGELAGEETVPTILRFATVYGASGRMRFDLVVNIMTAKAVTESRVNVYGGDQWRPNVHVQDAARSMVTAFEAPRDSVRGEVFNVGSDVQNHRIHELGKRVAESVPGTRVEVMGESPDPRSYRVSFAKIHRALGFAPNFGIEDGVREIASLLRDGGVTDYQEDRYYNVRYRYR